MTNRAISGLSPRVVIICLLISAAACEEPKRDNPEKSLTYTSGWATTEDGARVFYKQLGTGVPLVLIAGGPGSCSGGFHQTPTLLRGVARLIFLDNRGRGRSPVPDDPPEQRYTLEKDVLDVEAVRKALGVEKIAVFGQSYGTMVALAYAATYPQNTLALITSAGVHSATVWQERNIDIVKRDLEHQFPETWKEILTLRDAGRKTSDPEIIRLIFAQTGYFYAHDPAARERIARQFDATSNGRAPTWNPEVYFAMVGNDPEWEVTGSLKDVDLLPRMHRYTGPALVLGGRHDRISPPINQVEIAAALANARLVIFEHSGHVPYEEEPLRFLSVLTDFLLEVSSTTNPK